MSRTQRNKKLHRELNEEIQAMETQQNTKAIFDHVYSITYNLNASLHADLKKIGEENNLAINPFLEEKKSADAIDESIIYEIRRIEKAFGSLRFDKMDEKMVPKGEYIFNDQYYREIYEYVKSKKQLSDSDKYEAIETKNSARQGAFEDIDKDYYKEFVKNDDGRLIPKINEVEKIVSEVNSTVKKTYKNKLKKSKVRKYKYIYISMLLIILGCVIALAVI